MESEYSLWTREYEAIAIPVARELGIGFVSYYAAEPFPVAFRLMHAAIFRARRASATITIDPMKGRA